MPPRPFVAVIFLAWLATLAWLAADRWLPWLRPTEQPPFMVDLADEVAPQHGAWSVSREGGRPSSAETRMSPRKDGMFELSSRIRDLDASAGLDLRFPLLTTTRVVNRNGELVELESRAVVQLTGLGSDTRISILLRGEVRERSLEWECKIEEGPESITLPLPTRQLVHPYVMSPLQPLHRFPPLRPGQTWRVTNLDLLSETLSLAVNHAIKKKMGIRASSLDYPQELLARVEPDTEQITHRDRTYTCRVVTYQAQRVIAKTWVDVQDGRVIRHEANEEWATIRMQRE